MGKRINTRRPQGAEQEKRMGHMYDEEDVEASLRTVQDMIEVISDDRVSTALDSLMDAMCQLHGFEHPSGRGLPDYTGIAMCDAAEGASSVQGDAGVQEEESPVHQALIAALDVPEDADAVEWAAALRGLLEVATTHDETVMGRRAVEYLAAHIDPLWRRRPLPDGPGAWVGNFRQIDARQASNGRRVVMVVATYHHLGGLCGWTQQCGWVQVDDPRWDWLIDPNDPSKAARWR